MNPSDPPTASTFVRYQLVGVTPLSTTDEPSYVGQAWLGVVAGGLVAVRVDHVQFHGPVTDFTEAQIAALQKCLTDDRLAAFLDLDVSGSFFETIHSNAESAPHSTSALIINNQAVPAIRRAFEGYSATWPVRFDDYPLVVVNASPTLTTPISLQGF